MNLGDEHEYNNTQPTALFLADVLERSAQSHTQAVAAAELRRLHAERTAADGVINHLAAKVRGLQTQRDALLEALRLLNIECHQLHHNFKDRHDFVDPCPVVARIKAAIKAAEGGRHD